MSQILRLSDFRNRRSHSSRVFFSRTDLSRILGLYSARVARGEWRDYAIDHTAGIAIFSIFRHSLEQPAFAITKTRDAQGCEYAAYDVRRRLVRANNLSDVLEFLDTRVAPLDRPSGP